MRLQKNVTLLGVGLAAFSTASLLSTTSLYAQGALDEIIVTAQKREQNLQDTPISISAFNAASMDRLNIRDIEDVSHFTPNLRITSVASDAITASVAMRGTFNRNPTDSNSENTVGTYVDGVYVGKSNGALMDLADLERVEILRGPQGTLYGKNTIGGTINLISKKPSGEFDGMLRVGVGNKGLVYSKGSMNLPALGTSGEGAGALKARVAFLTRNRDGLFKNVPSSVPGANPPGGADEFNDIDRWGARIVLDWELNDSFSALYSYDKSEIDQNGVYSQAFKAGGFFAGVAPYVSQTRPKYVTQDYRDSFDIAEISGHSLTAEWNVGELGPLGDITLKSITAKRNVDSRNGYDLDGSALALLHLSRAFDYEQFSQELQFLGESDNLNYVIGLYYLNEEGDYNSYSDVFGFARSSVNIFDNDNKAIFAQFDWTPPSLEQLTLSVGGRYSDETKETFRNAITGGFTVVPATQLPELEFKEQTYMASAAWAFNDDVNVYLKYSEGYRSGSYDGQSRDGAAFDIPTDPEYLSSWEIGLKSRLLDDRLQLNVAAFTSDYSDMLISTWDAVNSTTATKNAGEAEISGVEIEALAQVTDDLVITMSYGYLHGEWVTYPVIPSGGGAVVELKDIAAVPQTPEQNFAIAFDYSFPAFSFGQLNFHIDYSYTDSLHIVPLDTSGFAAPLQEARIEPREMVNARLQLADVQMGGADVEFSLWGKNILDEDHVRSKFDAGSTVIGEWDEPRTYGAEMTVRF